MQLHHDAYSGHLSEELWDTGDSNCEWHLDQSKDHGQGD